MYVLRLTQDDRHGSSGGPDNGDVYLQKENKLNWGMYRP